jgi:clan AA aspartic protease (TIGR02281 family)
VALPYEGQGHSLVIPVVFGETEVPMLFDTGATVTTLSEEALTRLGVRVPADAPELKLRTANGERTARLVQVPEVWIGGMRVSPVTVGVCEECADGRVSGLLGLNVSGLFLVTVDSARKEVLFRARAEAPDRVVDIAPWLGLDALATVFPDGRIEVEVTANNRSQHAVSMAEVGIHCGEDSFVGSFSDIPPSGRSVTRVRLPRRTDCEGYSVTLDHARW